MAVARPAAGAALILLAACRGPAPPETSDADRRPQKTAPALPVSVPRPDDRRPASQAPVEAKSARAAGELVHLYFRLIKAHRYAEARRLWTGGGEGSGKSEAEFAAAYAGLRDYRVEIGTPGPIEGAAGSSYVTVPVEVHGRLDDGSPFGGLEDVTLRRINDVPGSTDEERRWHISGMAGE
jgi:hypothetical protein